jgi:sugar lactone lactonase YvrE
VPGKRTNGIGLGGDGIGVDCAGNIYTAAGTIIDANGGRVGSFPGGTNMAFGGDDMKTLLVLRGKGMQIVKMNLPGLPY